jgi:hypothetical protein
MVLAKRIVYDARTGEQREEEFDFTPPPTPTPPEPVSLEDLRKLIGYAKKMNWI